MTRDRGQDARMDRLLRAATSARPEGAAETTADCPEPDELAAYVEGALAANEREALEPHLASCARCQQSLALMVSMPDAPTSTAPAAPARGGWLAGWRRWLVPVSAVASAIILYVALQPEFVLRTRPNPESTATAPLQEAVPHVAATRAEQAPAANEPVVAKPAEAPPGNLVEARQAAPAGPPAMARASPAPGDVDAVPAPGAGTSAARHSPAIAAGATRPKAAEKEAVLPKGGEMAEALPDRAESGAVGGVLEMKPTRFRANETSGRAGTKAVADSRFAAPAPPPSPTTAPAALTQTSAAPTQEATAPAQVPAAPKQAPAAARFPSAAESARRADAPQPTVVSSGGPSPFLWRFDAGARILGSADGGRTWHVQHAGPGELASGSASSREICWAVGANGLVLRTIDGKTWTRVAFPEPLDLTAALSGGVLHATVHARDGRRFATEDGGTTWRER